MANKYLDQTGVQYLWSKIKSRDDATLQAAKKYVDDLLGMTDTDNAVVDKISEVLEVFENYSEGKNLLDFINSKLDLKNGGTVSGSLTASGYFEASSGVTTDAIFGKTSTRSIFVEGTYNSSIGGTPLDVGNIEANIVRLQGPTRPVWRRLNTDGSTPLTNELVIDSDLNNYLSKSGGIIKGDVEIQSGSLTLADGVSFIANNINLVDGEIYNEGMYTATFPSKSGTVAFTSDIPTNYVTTDTMQTIGGFKTFTSKTRFNQTVEIASNLTLESEESSEYGYSGKVKAVNLYNPTSDSEYRVEIPFRDGLVALASDLAIALTTTEIDAVTG